MNRIDKRFKELKKIKKKAFIVYITAGDPDLNMTEKLSIEMERCGVDILELGVPFSDPIADGPTIQAASQRALSNHANLKSILSLVKRIRKNTDIPIALMTYYNPVYAYGIKNFVYDARVCGVDGVIIPDLPPEEAGDLITCSKKRNFKNIFFLSPTSSMERVRLVSAKSSGFIYYVSLTGVTGARSSLPAEIVKNIRRIKRVTKKPVCVGFGVSNSSQVRNIAKIADGVIVGSAVIKCLERNKKKRDSHKRVGSLVRNLAKAIR